MSALRLLTVNATLFYGSGLITTNREWKNKRNNRNKCSCGASGELFGPFIFDCSQVNQPRWQRSLEVVRAPAGMDLVLEMNQSPNSTASILSAIQRCYKSLLHLIVFWYRMNLG